MLQFMNKKLITWVALFVVVIFAAGCGSSPAPAPKPAAPAAAPAAPAIDKAAETKAAAWDGYKKVLADVSGKTFPLDPAKAKPACRVNSRHVAKGASQLAGSGNPQLATAKKPCTRSGAISRR